MRRRSGILGVFLAHRGELVSYAAAIVGDRTRAEDVVQEAYLRFDAAALGRPLDEPLGYLYRIVRNIALDGRRQRRGKAATWSRMPTAPWKRRRRRGPRPK